ncbi:hypothetical protein ACFVVC_01210 [Pseudarthrobacter sp. NPDC058196]|uniref:hypothetical protein n=1 Tax=Pseudarthrobacter sp. NPDC058196 TaxID=3346376 RepID=UPI0036DAB477
MTYQDYETPPAPSKRRAGLWWKIAIAVVGVLAIGAGVIGAITLSSINAAAEASVSASASAAASRSAEASASAAKAKAQADLDQSIKDLAAAVDKTAADAAKADRVAMEKNGWKYVSDYLYYATPTKHFTCPSHYGCASFIVTNTMQPNGCPSGVSANVSFLAANGLSVYSSIRSSGALRPGEQAQLDFTDLSGNGATYRVDSMNCY